MRWVSTTVACHRLSPHLSTPLSSCALDPASPAPAPVSCHKDDTKAGKASGSGNKRSSGTAAALPAAAGKEVLPGVNVKGADLSAPAAKPGSSGKSTAAAAAQSDSGGKNAGAEKSGQPACAEAPAGKSGSGGKRKVAPSAAPAAEAGTSRLAQQAGKSAAAAAGGPDSKRQKAGGAAAHLTVQERRGTAAAAAAPLALPAEQGDAPAALVMPGSDAEKLLEQYSANFRALQVRRYRRRPTCQLPACLPARMPCCHAAAGICCDELALQLFMSAPRRNSLPPKLFACYLAVVARLRCPSPSLCQADYDKLQALYEDLKAAKIDEEVQQLLEQQNRYVSEHGQKAAALVEHYKKEVRPAGCWLCACLLETLSLAALGR